MIRGLRRELQVERSCGPIQCQADGLFSGDNACPVRDANNILVSPSHGGYFLLLLFASDVDRRDYTMGINVTRLRQNRHSLRFYRVK